MRRRSGHAAAAGAALIATAAACLAAAAPNAVYRWRLPAGVAPPPVPSDNPMTDIKVELGRKLFYDADLSINGTMSCGTCHEQHRAFSDGNSVHPGVTGAPARRNPMPLVNIGYFASLTWGDATVHSLESQVATPVTGEAPVEMGMAGQTAAIAERLGGDPCYRRMFAAAFPAQRGAIDMTTVSHAIAAFERTLISMDAPYDRYRRGDHSAISDAAKRGEALFVGERLNCAGCHAGPMFTDAASGDAARSFHNIGPTEASRDHGLREITNDPKDEGRFRTPGLRNVALSAPYLHDGSAKTLPDAIRRHAGAPAALGDAEVGDIAAFLDTLTDRGFLTDPRFALPKPQCVVPG